MPITYEQAVAGLKQRASFLRDADLSRGKAAAIRLLTWHDSWLRRPDFRSACLIRGPLEVNWAAVRRYRYNNPRNASSSQMAILDVALTLAEDTLGLGGFGHAHQRAVAEAFATALGQGLVPAVPRHAHPEFIECEAPCPLAVSNA